MSKQSQSPPRGDKPTPTAPPPPPAWRHWLWPIGLLAAVVLFLFLPRVSGVPSVNLTYSQFLSDVNAHKVKTFTLDNSTGSTAPGTGTLKDGKDYTTVVPLPFAGTPLATTLEKAGVNIDAAPPSTGFGTELLFLLISLLPIIFVFWLIRRMSQAGGAACWAASRAWAGPGPRSSTPSGRRPSSPTWPAMSPPNARSARWSTSSSTRSGTAGSARSRPAAC